MKELKLSLTERINLRTSNHIQYATTEHFENGEKVVIKKVGICTVKTSGIRGLITLKITQKQWMYSKEGELIKTPEWGLT